MSQKIFLRIHGVKVYRMFDELRETFKEEGLEPWTSCEFILQRDSNLVSFDYIDWIKWVLAHQERKTIICIKSLVFYQKWNMGRNSRSREYVKDQSSRHIIEGCAKPTSFYI